MIKRCLAIAALLLLIPAAAIADTVYVPLAIYQPIAADGDPVVAIPGHGEQIRINRDWALIQCGHGERMEFEQVNQTLIVRCMPDN